MNIFLKKKLLLLFLSLIITLLFIGFVSAAPGSSPNADYPVFITIDENPGENIFIFTDHTSDQQNGNWIALLTGETLLLPSTAMNFDLSASFLSTGGKTFEV